VSICPNCRGELIIEHTAKGTVLAVFCPDCDTVWELAAAQKPAVAIDDSETPS
jgi:Zn-finger nucleic acid-binding protein